MPDLERAKWVRCGRCIYWTRMDGVGGGICNVSHADVGCFAREDSFCGEGRFLPDGEKSTSALQTVELEKGPFS